MPDAETHPNASAVSPRPWTRGLGHNAIALYLSAAFLDRLPAVALPAGGPIGGTLAVAIAGLVGFALIYLAPASRAFRARRPFSEVAADTFGEVGARWVPGALLAIGHALAMAVALSIAADYGARGLINLGFLEPADVRDVTVGGLTLKARLLAFEMLAWGLFAATMAAYAIRVVSAVMFTYPAFPALTLAAAFVATLPGIGAATIPEGAASGPAPDDTATFLAALLTVQYVCGFLALAVPALADWSAASAESRDVTLGGFVGVAVAPAIVAALALAFAAGTLGPRPSGGVESDQPSPSDATPMLPRPGTRPPAEERLAELLGHAAPEAEPRALPSEAADLTFGSALQYGWGGRPGGIALLVFALGLLGPVVYAPYGVIRGLEPIAPRMSPIARSLACLTIAWPLAVTGLVDDVPAIYGLFGAVFGPVAGAIVADVLRDRGRGPGPRPNVRPTALVAWGVGLLVGLLPYFGAIPGLEALRAVQPATLLAFAAACAVAFVLPRRTPPTHPLEPTPRP